MLTGGAIVLISSLYLCMLFLVAYISDHNAERGRAKFIKSPLIYTLSLAVYCTSWTFYGAVGSAARNGLEYLTIYLGPTLVLMGWWLVMAKILRICRDQNITSIADFISARYGASNLLSALVTLIALVGVTPYIALQLQAVATSFDAFNTTDTLVPEVLSLTGVFKDTGFWVAASMAFFVIFFGTRKLAADERHPGIVAAIALESMVKLISLGAVAFFAVFYLNDGVQDLYENARMHEAVQRLATLQDGFEPRWITLIFLSAAAFICLPRQFQVSFLEGAGTRHLAMASWMFPLYMFLVSLFVIPITLAGLTSLPETANPDLFVLSLPLASGAETLAIFAFIGGLSAATSMVIVASIALSTMISNHWVLPILLMIPSVEPRRQDFAKTLLRVRRVAIIAILTLGFGYYYIIGAASSLASIGLTSFVGVAQFLPALIGGIYWNGGTKAGATTGLVVGFAIWFYTLLVPSIMLSDAALTALVEHGPLGIAFLKPDALFGLAGWDPIVHGLVWSLSANMLLYALVSALTRQSPMERLQSAVFVDAFRSRRGMEGAVQRTMATDDLYQVARRILGGPRTDRLFRDHHRQQGLDQQQQPPEPKFVARVERELAGSVGAASARTLVSRIAQGETISLETVISLLDDTQEILRYSQELERKSTDLAETAEKLGVANEKLTRLDKMKDDFLSQVSHELRTPMTSIRSFSEILGSQSALEEGQIRHFVGIIEQESVRLTRLLDEILELNRLESGDVQLNLGDVDVSLVARDAIETMRGLADSRAVILVNRLDGRTSRVIADPDRLKQVFINLLSNAVKFNDSEAPWTWIEFGPRTNAKWIEILVRDNGPGIPSEDRQFLFSKFSRGWRESSGRTDGSGLGLAISRQIMDRLGGSVDYVDSRDTGTAFALKLRRR